MANEDVDKLIAQLSSLSPRERQVLECRCLGWDYETIATHLVITKKAVKTYCNRIYDKLALKGYGRAARMKLLYEEYCPLLQKTGKAPEKVEVVTGEVIDEAEARALPEPSVSAEDEKMLDEDEYAVVLVERAPLAKIPKKSPPRPWWLAWLVGGVVLGTCLGAVAIYLLLRSPGGPLAAVPQPTPTLAAPTPMPGDTTIPSPVAAVPTQTPLVVVVTATLPPATEAPTSPTAPAISLPFSDSFENGADPKWRILSGTWITANGAFTTVQQGTQNSWYWTVLDGSSWQNYRVTVDIHIPYAYAASQGAAAVLVRRTENQTKYLGFYIDTFLTGSWALIGNRWSDEQSIAGTGQNLPDTATFQLEANGNSFTARVNGQTYQHITISGYDQGGVGLGVLCEADKCPSFDNFKVEPLGP